MHKGDLFTVSMDGVEMTVCVVDIYREEESGEDVVVLAVIERDHLLRVRLEDLKPFLPESGDLN
ncbi:MAG: hypothetical protein QHH05_06100 [Syntrophomonadaceae bacterium]|nr:hypothetical protein [Syntrophomonadaceae bacterium]